MRPDAIRRALTTAIRAADPALYLAEVSDPYETAFRFAAKGRCTLAQVSEFAQDIFLSASQGKLQGEPQISWFQVGWHGASIEFVGVSLKEGYSREIFGLMMGEEEAVKSFIVALEEFSNEVDGAVLVFQDGCWRYDEDLFEDIQTSTFDNLVLPSGMSEQIRGDVQQWLDSRDLYEQHGIPWKRGMILVGPPGNGKTHMIKALANYFGLSTLYVRGFTSEYGTDAANISKVFHKARACAPSMLILEDLDTLVNSENRSHFLNELDGFARNTGILAVASANDPARLDPALINRPSRFDRRYAFNLPEAEERTRYLQFFTSSLDVNLRLSDEEAAALGEEAGGFSFAYLKELVLSSMMSWISSGRVAPFAAVIREQIAPLLEQMQLEVEPTPTPSGESSDDSYMKMVRAMRRRRHG